MDRVRYIIKPFRKWLWELPMGFLSIYNLLRQEEIIPGLPSLGELLDDIHWAMWLAIFILIAAIIIIEGLIRYNKYHPRPESSGTEVESQKQMGGITQAFGEVHGDVVQHYHAPSTHTPKTINVGNSKPVLLYKIVIIPNLPPKDQYGNQTLFKFTVKNDCGYNLRKCEVFLDELCYSPSKKRKKDWTGFEYSISEKPFRWDVLLSLTFEYAHIDDGKRAAFILGTQNQYWAGKERDEKKHQFLFTFFQEKLSVFEKGNDYRLLIRLSANYLLSYTILPIQYYIYFKENSKLGGWAYDTIERINNESNK